MKQKEVEQQYVKLLKDVETDEFYTKTDLTNRVNCYVCQSCGHITKTKDIDSGVTPFMFSCENCGKIAHSSFYKDIAPTKEPTIEWYRPTLKAILDKPWEYDINHVLQGGLEPRKRK